MGKKPSAVLLKNYKKPAYTISDIFLTVELEDTRTIVTSKMSVKVNDTTVTKLPPLVLDGDNLLCRSVSRDGRSLKDDQFSLTENSLVIHDVAASFELEIVNEINPQANKALEGLYKSGGIFCTQNEPEGFRRITYFIDRPDVMAKFSTKIVANREKYPVLLSNGNPLDHGQMSDGRHWILWEDPFPKPCYLYALVAGDLGLVQDTFTTKSNRQIDLRIYCDKGNEYKCGHAMASLKKSMKWDEDIFGLEYDLDIYMIVAVDSFNMGAMENKGLNIFNSACVLADPQTATDSDFLGVESVIAHEYFHNWTGNRVTCRDWFQLTLKEGLTVFRDQQFSADMNSANVKRIEDVGRLRTRQFPEDAGPMSHPIKPDSYIEINNFYTATIYEKGAEVIRMIYTLIGHNKFVMGIKKYFELYDGQAVTTEDFIYAMQLASGFDFTQFVKWYHRAGTPEIELKSKFDKNSKQFEIEIIQKTNSEALYFPLKTALITEQGREILEETLHIKELSNKFVFKNIEAPPHLSINRGFSAPIKIHGKQNVEELIFLMANDRDGFNRYEASFQLSKSLINDLVVEKSAAKWKSDERYLSAFGQLLADRSIDDLFKAKCLNTPTMDNIFQDQAVIDFDATYLAREFMIGSIAKKFKNEFLELYKNNNEAGDYALTPKAIGRRELKNIALAYLCASREESCYELAYEQFKNAGNMTDSLMSFKLLVDYPTKYSESAIADFYEKWKKETLVIQKWLAAQATSPQDNVYDKVVALGNSEVYSDAVPNLVRSLYGSFSTNHLHFNHKSGRGYTLLAEKIIELDRINPQIASSLATKFNYFKRLRPENQKAMLNQLQKIVGVSNISKNVYEIVSKILR